MSGATIDRAARAAQHIAAAIGPLPFTRARSRAAQGGGNHPLKRAGAGSEFWQYRTLEPGEAADKIDWRRSARSDEVFVREREREDPVRAFFWCDGSASMQFTSDPSLLTKFETALALTGGIAIAASEADEHCAAPPNLAPLRPGQLLDALAQTKSATPELPPAGPSDIVIAAADFLDEGALDWAHAHAGTGAKGLIFIVQDKAEIEFPFSGRLAFDAVEHSDTAFEVNDAAAIAGKYQQVWAAHNDKLRKFAAETGWKVLFVSNAGGARAITAAAGEAAAWLQEARA